MVVKEARQGFGWEVWVRHILGLRGAVAGALRDKGLVALDEMDEDQIVDDAEHSRTDG